MYVVDPLIQSNPKVALFIETHTENRIVLQSFAAGYIAIELTLLIDDHYTLQHRAQSYRVVMQGKGVQLVLLQERIRLRAERFDRSAVIYIQSSQIGGNEQSISIQRLYASHLILAQLIRTMYPVQSCAGQQVQSIIGADIYCSSGFSSAVDTAVDANGLNIRKQHLSVVRIGSDGTDDDQMAGEEVHMLTDHLYIPHLPEVRFDVREQ